jgi:hypothetical protein
MNLAASIELFANRKLHKRLTYQGLSISVENRAGSVRTGKDPKWGVWHTKMLYDYGYIRGTKGMDGGGVDCFIGPVSDAKFAYVVHILKQPDFKVYDEDKVMLGFASKSAAKAAFMKHYDMPEKFYGGMDVIPMNKFKEKVLSTGKTGPKKITLRAEYHSDGAPGLGVAHIDPGNSFHPPSLKNPQHVPADNPNEKDDRFLDVTRRNDAENERYRKSRTSNIGTDGRTVPVNTTYIGLYVA